MTTEHTTGPWAYAERFIGDESCGLEVVAKDDRICSLPGIGFEDLANARLIAAAPQLLAALQGVLKVADRKTVEFDMARQAINKALKGAL